MVDKRPNYRKALCGCVDLEPAEATRCFNRPRSEYPRKISIHGGSGHVTPCPDVYWAPMQHADMRKAKGLFDHPSLNSPPPIFPFLFLFFSFFYIFLYFFLFFPFPSFFLLFSLSVRLLSYIFCLPLLSAHPILHDCRRRRHLARPSSPHPPAPASFVVLVISVLFPPVCSPSRTGISASIHLFFRVRSTAYSTPRTVQKCVRMISSPSLCVCGPFYPPLFLPIVSL